jgi:uncharacterized protein
MCVGCRKRREKNELIRLAKNAEGVFIRSGKRNPEGRGFYLCPESRCVRAAMKKQGKGISGIDLESILN